MSNTTKIQWADMTFNPWIGCTKVSAGCKNCYAEKTTRARVLRSQGQETWGKGALRSRTSAATWKQPIKWNNEVIYDEIASEDERNLGKDIPPWLRPRIFPSLCDWLDDEVPIEWLADFLKLIHDTPNLDWLLLTKRPENFKRRLGDAVAISDEGSLRIAYEWLGCTNPPNNVWMGVSVEDQEMADKRIPELLKIPAKIRFLSVEPMLGPIDLRLAKQVNRNIETPNSGPWIKWIIFGGESGPKARPCDMQWIRDGVKQCQTAGVAAFVKQLGSTPMWVEQRGSHYKTVHQPHFKDKKGGDMAEWPVELRVREFPEASSI